MLGGIDFETRGACRTSPGRVSHDVHRCGRVMSEVEIKVHRASVNHERFNHARSDLNLADAATAKRHHDS